MEKQSNSQDGMFSKLKRAVGIGAIAAAGVAAPAHAQYDDHSTLSYGETAGTQMVNSAETYEGQSSYDSDVNNSSAQYQNPPETEQSYSSGSNASGDYENPSIKVASYENGGYAENSSEGFESIHLIEASLNQKFAKELNAYGDGSVKLVSYKSDKPDAMIVDALFEGVIVSGEKSSSEKLFSVEVPVSVISNKYALQELMVGVMSKKLESK